jgi:hypothetical protein
VLGNGIDVLRQSLALKEIMGVVEATARWVSPETFRLFPVWYPEYARGMHLSTGNWSEPRMRGNGVPALETNVQAAKALTAALGLSSAMRRNWSCCHIWGVDDPTFASRNSVVRDHRFYSCVGNMVLLPDPLKAFTDSVPEVKLMLRACARNLYGRPCGGGRAEEPTAAEFTSDPAWPASWPRTPGGGEPAGVMPLTDVVRARAAKRKVEIARDLQWAGPRYPREEVRRALAEFDVVL